MSMKNFILYAVVCTSVHAMQEELPLHNPFDLLPPEIKSDILKKYDPELNRKNYIYNTVSSIKRIHALPLQWMRDIARHQLVQSLIFNKKELRVTGLLYGLSVEKKEQLKYCNQLIFLKMIELHENSPNLPPKEKLNKMLPLALSPYFPFNENEKKEFQEYARLRWDSDYQKKILQDIVSKGDPTDEYTKMVSNMLENL